MRRSPLIKFSWDSESSQNLAELIIYWEHFHILTQFLISYLTTRIWCKILRISSYTLRAKAWAYLQRTEAFWDRRVLPLVVHIFVARRDKLETKYHDSKTNCHYQMSPLLYWSESQDAWNLGGLCIKDAIQKKLSKVARSSTGPPSRSW